MIRRAQVRHNIPSWGFSQDHLRVKKKKKKKECLNPLIICLVKCRTSARKPIVAV